MEGQLVELRTAASEGVAVVRQSPLLRGHAPLAQAASELVVPLDRCVRNLRVLARRASVSITRDEVVPARYVDRARALDEAAGNVKQAARSLGVSDQTIYNWLEEFGMTTAGPCAAAAGKAGDPKS